jgi:hypothetical protein
MDHFFLISSFDFFCYAFYTLAFIAKLMNRTEQKGGNKGIRTLGPCLAKAVLYQLSYIPIF